MNLSHPGMADRWMRQGNASSESEETSKPGVPKLPRKSEAKRDWGPLTPSPQNRLKLSKASSEKDSMEEDGVEAHTGTHGGKMSLKTHHVLDPLAKRDVQGAARKRVWEKTGL